jgi:hypothetical protein
VFGGDGAPKSADIVPVRWGRCALKVSMAFSRLKEAGLTAS